MTSQQSQLSGWRARIKAWLQNVEQYRRMYGVDYRTAAAQNQAAFPRNAAVLLMRQVASSLAVWIVKAALKDAASGLDISISDESLAILADVAVASL